LGACQFYLSALIDTDGSVIIKESNLKHTVCTEESNSAAIRKKFTVPRFMADRAAACASVNGSHGRKEALVRKLIGSQGYLISDFTVACALADANRNECLANKRFGSLVGFFRDFESIAEANFATVEIDPANHFVRAALVSEAGVLGVQDGQLAGIVSCDFSHAAGKVRVADAKGSVDAEDSSGDDEEVDETNTTLVQGRPNMTTADMGRIGVCVGRNYSGNRVILSIGVVSSETKENAEWLLRFTESKVGLLRKYPTVNFITDRSAAIRSAIASVYGDRATLTNCYVHFRRNVLDNTHGSTDEKALVYECLNRIFYATSEEEVEERMRELKEISLEAYNYVLKVEKSSWVPLFLSFNPLDNVTSNDAETVFASKKAFKNKGDVFGFIHATMSAESKKLSDLSKDSMKHFGHLISAVLQKKYDSKLAEAASILLISQSGRDVLVVAHVDYPDTTFFIDLRNLNNQRLWCSCRLSARLALPCVHVFAAILRYGALCWDINKVIPGGCLRRNDGGPNVHTLTVPATVTIKIESVLRPHWAVVALSADQIPSDAFGRARAIKRVSKASFYPPSSGSRMLSQGENDTLEAASVHRRHDVRRQKFKLSVGTFCKARTPNITQDGDLSRALVLSDLPVRTRHSETPSVRS